MRAVTDPRGVVLRGRVWPGGDAVVLDDAVVVLTPTGTVARIGPAATVDMPDLPVLGGEGAWVGPGVVDAHVHLAFGAAETELRGGVVAVRDLGAPSADAARWRGPGPPAVAVSGPILTAPHGYPSNSWGARGFARFVDSPHGAGEAVRALHEEGVDVIKIALEPAAGQAVPHGNVVRAIVEAAHARSLTVTAHALTAAMVERALDAGVDELCHTPAEPLSEALVERIATAGIPVVSTLQTFVDDGSGEGALANAAALHRAGVPLVYGTDLGNTGTRPGVDPRELDRLAHAGLGRAGALRAATGSSATRLAGCPISRIVVGENPFGVVVLPRDPLVDSEAWRTPVAVTAGDRTLVR